MPVIIFLHVLILLRNGYNQSVCFKFKVEKKLMISMMPVYRLPHGQYGYHLAGIYCENKFLRTKQFCSQKKYLRILNNVSTPRSYEKCMDPNVY